MAKNMEWENISSKTGTFTTDRCIKAKCKAKENIPGQTKTSMKEHSSKTR